VAATISAGDLSATPLLDEEDEEPPQPARTRATATSASGGAAASRGRTRIALALYIGERLSAASAEALAELAACAGSQFDADVVRALTHVVLNREDDVTPTFDKAERPAERARSAVRPA
jgi:hypothetical protein